MDPLQLPLISKYEWEYKNAINQRMRVPDKLSLASSLPDLDSTNSSLKEAHYPDQRLREVEHPRNTPGYTPDLLIDGEAQTVPSTQVTATANATASTTIQVAHGTSAGYPSVNERLRTAETRLSHLEAYVSRLSSRLRGVEQQQALMGGLITIYFGLKVIVKLCVSVVTVQVSLSHPPSLLARHDLRSRPMTFTSTRMPTNPTPDDLAKRDKLRHTLKIAFILLGLTTVVILGVGIYVTADPGQYNHGLMVLGCVLIVLAIVCLIASVVTGNLLFHLIRAVSETKVYQPKDAEGLRDKPYPRQPNDTVRRRRAPVRGTAHQTRTQLDVNSEEQIRDASANRIALKAGRAPEPLPAPSAPPPIVSADNNQNAEGDDCEKVLPPAPDLERPPPFAPPPGLPPPSYDEISWL
ncbi:hypothetical protein TcWFU_002599 [Taenia crassiceps]|uniref:Uncharacterized protein n=1 Tax=Taenia crassiceps TaxID=6207 RepID=A0ABR4Q3B7_9CEST